jgi:acyl-CoA dehydrogenase
MGDMSETSSTFGGLHERVRNLARTVAAIHADDVDRMARFPSETLAALREACVLSAPVPVALGGAGLTLSEQAQLCATLGKACGASGMVLAMHFSQLACLTRHCGANENFEAYLRELHAHQYLLASMTSEQGTFGDTRTSICALQVEGETFTLEKDATTGSYCAFADAILVTCRRDADAAGSDQVLALVARSQYELTQSSDWDTMGMRGTCSPGFRLKSRAPSWQVVPGPFADCAAETMVPYSHVLWAALWSGIVAGASARAADCVRSAARKTPGRTPATALALARLAAGLQALRQQWLALAHEFDVLDADPDQRAALHGMNWALKFNSLKVNASNAAPQLVHMALQIVGIPGYKNSGPYSLSRHYRDVLSASLMISNERVLAKNADMLLVLKDF